MLEKERKFNVTGTCVPSMHYMADTSEKITQIMQLVDDGEYFSINRGRQYGKTTTLSLLEKQLSSKYTVVKISFEVTTDIMFESEEGFCQGLLNKCAKYLTKKNYRKQMFGKMKPSKILSCLMIL